MPRFFSWAIAGVLAAAGLSAVHADGNFHKVSYYTDGMQSFEGTIIVPPRYTSGGTVFLWPGFQDPNNRGVLQPVLDGRGQHWYFGNTWVGSPSEPYGGGVNADINQRLGFYMRNINNSGNWAIGVSNPAGDKADYEYDIGVQMNQALFVAEIYPDATWDFGNVVFEDVTITALGTDPSWCTSTPLYSSVTPTIEGVSSSVNNGVVSCYIQRLTLAP